MTIDLRFATTKHTIEFSIGVAQGTLRTDTVQFGHLGCKLLATVRPVGQLPPEVISRWNTEYGSYGAWRRPGPVRERVAVALANVLRATGLLGAILWDTMRKGSDYWRPGAHLSDVAILLRENHPDLDVSYARDDAMCPPAHLLESFRSDENMSFGAFAHAYAEYLQSSGGLERAAAAVLMAASTGQLAIFYCVDPYIPGYARSADLAAAVPYTERTWLPGFRDDGCHRFILAEELMRFFTRRSVSCQVFEIDQTLGQARMREFASLLTEPA